LNKHHTGSSPVSRTTSQHGVYKLRVNSDSEKWYLEQILNGNIVGINGEFSFRGKPINVGNIDGYRRCYLCPEGRGSTKAIQHHRLVWMYDAKKLIPDSVLVNHKDGVKDRNLTHNLELATNQQNVQHAFDTGLAKRTDEANIKAVNNNPLTVFTHEEVIRYREQYISGKLKQKDIVMTSKCSLKTVQNMLNCKTYKHVR
jgi:HNH endonuclease